MLVVKSDLLFYHVKELIKTKINNDEKNVARMLFCYII